MRLFVPGRVCLFGEHSDWAGGYRRIDPRIEKGLCLIAGTNQGIHAEVEPHPASLVLSSTTGEGERHGPIEIPCAPDALLETARAGGFWSYIAGVAWQVRSRFPRVGGLVIENDRTDLPVKKGLSSSAAVCVLAARAFNRLYGLGLTTREEMEIAYQGERTTPSRCGRMDQGCAFGRRAVLMTFDGEEMDAEEIAAGAEFFLVLVDLRARKDTTTILSRLHAAFPDAADPIARGVRELLGPVNRRIVGEAVQALRAGDGERLGALMTEAQELFDRLAAPICPEELAAPALHRVLAHEPLRALAWGGKGVGSQGDGSAQILARSEGDQQAIVEIIERDLRMPCLTMTAR